MTELLSPKAGAARPAEPSRGVGVDAGEKLAPRCVVHKPSLDLRGIVARYVRLLDMRYKPIGGTPNRDL